ncbi:MAG: MBL fold metallo-hydrolase [Patescibacteria group bacterium]|jgi:competence protein ComEC
MSKIKNRILKFYLAVIAGIVILAVFLFLALQPRNLAVYFLAVGQGDATLIITPDRHNILVDGGPDNEVIYGLGKYLPFYDRKIDLMVLTHPHADHVVGLIEVLKRYQVKKILITDVTSQLFEYQLFLNLARQNKIEIEILNRRGIMPLGSKTNFFILFPETSLKTEKIKNLNDSSIVLKLVYGQTAVLLPGDLEIEEDLVRENLDLRAEILKVGHHGSGNANNPLFLQAVKPIYAVIPCGLDNKFGLPQQKTIDELQSIGAKIFRTDFDGDLYFYSTGQQFYFEKITPLKKIRNLL